MSVHRTASIVFAAAIALSTLAHTDSAAAAGGTQPSAAAIDLIDQRGATFSLASIRSPYIAVTFVSARCSDTCPIANAAFARLQVRVRRERLPLSLVTITLDPRHDTPHAMRAVARQFRSDPSVWRVASGPVARVETVAHAFGVIAEFDRSGIPATHGTFIYLLNRDRQLEKMFLLSTSLTDDVVAALPPRERTSAKRS